MATRYTDIPLELGSKTALVYNAEVVVQRVKVLLTTEPGEMLDVPLYGTPIQEYLYENITDSAVQFIKMSIEYSIQKWMGDQVRLDTIRVVGEYDKNSISVYLGLYIIEFGTSVNVVQSFKA